MPLWFPTLDCFGPHHHDIIALLLEASSLCPVEGTESRGQNGVSRPPSFPAATEGDRGFFHDFCECCGRDVLSLLLFIVQTGE